METFICRRAALRAAKVAGPVPASALGQRSLTATLASSRESARPQKALARRRRAVSFGQETRARSLHLAASDQGRRLADAGAALDAAGRDRLAASGAHLRAADGGVNRHAFFIHIFFRGLGFWVRFFLAHPKSSGIPRAR